MYIKLKSKKMVGLKINKKAKTYRKKLFKYLKFTIIFFPVKNNPKYCLKIVYIKLT